MAATKTNEQTNIQTNRQTNKQLTDILLLQDSNGWTYASDFYALNWYPAQKKGTFVRRRLWQRQLIEQDHNDDYKPPESKLPSVVPGFKAALPSAAGVAMSSASSKGNVAILQKSSLPKKKGAQRNNNENSNRA